MVHIDHLNRKVTGQGNTFYPLTYNQYSVWIYNQHSVWLCKRYKYM